MATTPSPEELRSTTDSRSKAAQAEALSPGKPFQGVPATSEDKDSTGEEESGAEEDGHVFDPVRMRQGLIVRLIELAPPLVPETDHLSYA